MPDLQLRPFRETEISTVLGWPQTEAEFYRWSAGKFGAYPAQPADVLRFYANPAYRFCGIYTAFDAFGPCGHCTLRYLDGTRTALRLGFIILNPASRGKGYGKAMLRLVLDAIQPRYPGLPVSLSVFAENHPAIHCYQAVGFRFTGETEHIRLPNGSLHECRTMEAVL